MDIRLVLRHIALIIHIIAAGVWIAQFPVGMFFDQLLRPLRGQRGELALLGTRGRILNAMGQTSGPIILITGLIMLATNGLGLLGLFAPTPTWLFIKQVIYIVAMGVVFVLLVPAQRQLQPKMIEAMQNATEVTPELREIITKMGNYSTLINVLVLINIILAVWKPI